MSPGDVESIDRWYDQLKRHKPHLRKQSDGSSSFWVCRGQGMSVSGKSPTEAYKWWDRQRRYYQENLEIMRGQRALIG